MLSLNRKKAIIILETLAEELGKPRLFDKRWFEFEDIITEILGGDQFTQGLSSFEEEKERR